MMNEKVSIIVPVYNAEKTIKRCLESLLCQTYSNIQILLINDGSKDQSLKICKEYEKQDSRIEVLTHENHGVSYTRNRGIEQSTGEWIMFVDSDDYVKDDMVEKYVEAMKSNYVDVVVGGIHFWNNGRESYDKIPNVIGKLNRTEFWKALCEEDNRIWGYVPNKMYRMQIIRDHNLKFNERMKAQEDLAFAIDYYSLSETFFAIDYCGYYYEYVLAQRTVPVEDLIGNQQKILTNAQNTQVEYVSQKSVIRKIQKQIYTCLYYCKSVEEIDFIMKIPKLIEDIIDIEGLNGEEKRILSWFVEKKARYIWLYFKIRNGLRKMLKRN